MRVLLLLAAVGAVAAQAYAQAPIPGPEVEQTVVRHDEDWSVLRGEPREGWQRAKYVLLDARGDTWLTLGGETRARFERFDNNQWGEAPASDDGYLWHRTMAHTDVRAGPGRAFVQLIAGYARGVGGGNGPADETGIDLLQGFADLRLDLGDAASLTLRGGRELVSLGSGRLLSTRYGLNIPQAFDGAHAIAVYGPLRIEAFHLRPVANGEDDFDDATSKARRLDGIYATIAPAPDIGVDAYWFGYANEQARFTRRTGREARDTFGLRFFGRRGDFGWDWEAIIQRGRFNGQRIRAWSLATETDWHSTAAPLRPRLRLRANIASGDSDPGDGRLETFNALFPSGKYFGNLSPIGPRNFVNVHPSIDVELGSGVTVEIAVAAFWRARRGDGIYDVPGQLLRGAGENGARHIGNQVEIAAAWQANPCLSFAASLSAFRPGAFLRETRPSRTIRLATAEAMFKF